MTENNQKQIGYILVDKDKAILNSEIDAKHFFKTKEEAFLKLKPSIDENPVLLEIVELATVEGYYVYWGDDYDREFYDSLQERCGFRVKLSSIGSKKGLHNK